jgi:hypothetical protein
MGETNAGSFLDALHEGQVYEMLLVTKSNVTPVGVVKIGRKLLFRLFGGRSARELVEHPYASLQVTNDANLIVRLALNLPPREGLEIQERGNFRWIKGLPGGYGKVERGWAIHRDELGETKVLNCSLEVLGEIEGSLLPKPFSRADCALIEMAVDLTRLRVAILKNPHAAERLCRRIKENYSLYTHLGGRDESGRKIAEEASELCLSEEFKKV